MGRQLLSQEEINALLQDAERFDQLTPLQKVALKDINNLCYAAGANTLSGLLKKQIRMNTRTVHNTSIKKFIGEHPGDYLMIDVNYLTGFNGGQILFLKTKDALLIADLIMGRDGFNTKTHLGEVENTAVTEAICAMLNGVCSFFSTVLGKRIAFDQLKIHPIHSVENQSLSQRCDWEKPMVALSFKLQVENLIDSKMIVMTSYRLAAELADFLILQTEEPASCHADKSVQFNKSEPVPNLAKEPSDLKILRRIRRSTFDINNLRKSTPVQTVPYGKTTPLKAGNEVMACVKGRLLEFSVELGSTRMKLKDVVELGIGSTFELDCFTGDPVGIFINNKLIAKGEIVMIGEKYGIRIIDIINPTERINILQ